MKCVSIIMVNYNGVKYIGKKDLQEAIESFLKTDYPDFEFIFVDNASTDKSVALVRNILKKYPSVRAKIIINKRNLGFAGGCNIGIEHSEGEYICLVNNDDKPVDNNWLRELVKVIESNNKIGAVFSKKIKWTSLNEVDARGMTITPPGFVIGPTNLSDEVSVTPCLIWQTPVLFRKALIREIGGNFFDDDYLILHDDTDSSIRIWLAGYKIVYVPTSVVSHKRSATMKALPVEFVCFHGRKNIIQTIIKNYQFKNLVQWLPITISIYLALIVYYLLVKRIDHVKATFKAIVWNIRNFGKILQKRKIIQRYVRKVSDTIIFKLMKPFSILQMLKSKKIWPR